MAHYNEDLYVEKPFLEQLQNLGWNIVYGNKDDANITFRQSFKEILIEDLFTKSIKKINSFLETDQIEEIFGELKKINKTNLFEANEQATDILLNGLNVDQNRITGEKSPSVKIIDFDNLENNIFTAISQYKVNIPGTEKHIIPDITLFINGIPIGIVECKSPKISEAIEEAIYQLKRYQNDRGAENNEGNEKLFYFNQLLIATSRQETRIGTIKANAEHYLEWKDLEKNDNSQNILIKGVLKKENILDIINNFIVFKSDDKGRKIKILCRYQQYRAVNKAINKLTNKSLSQEQKGGIIWHTQGSGKSLTMIFLIRKFRKTKEGKKFKIIFLTDRTDLQRQIGETAKTIGETIYPKNNKDNNIKNILKEISSDDSNIVNAMIHKFQSKDNENPDKYVKETKLLTELNNSPNILLLIDEAHRSQDGTLGANLSNALPNAIKIGFTGTPIITGKLRKKSHEIFGEYIDTYTIEQAVKDGATVQIIYEGRTSQDIIKDKQAMDKEFIDMFKDYTDEERQAILKKYGNKQNYLDAPEIIEQKANDMIQYYIDKIFINGFKAQVVVNSRKSAILYKKYLDKAIKQEIEKIKNGISNLKNKDFIDLEILKELETTVIISSNHNDEEFYKKYTNSVIHKTQIENFKKPFENKDKNKKSSLGIIIVTDMLLTGFDAPIEQVLFLDKKLIEHNLLQTIARVNRTASGKNCGYLVDYYGIANNLKEALEIFSDNDIKGAMINLDEEIPRLDEKYRKVVQIFEENGIKSFDTNEDIDLCIDLLEDVSLRAKFTVAYRKLSKSIDIVSPDKAILKYINNYKAFGFILFSAKNRYRDNQLNIIGTGKKVKKLIDKYITSQGIDPNIPPISIMDDDFDKFINGIKSNKSKASEMEHAIRYHISENFEKDPEFFKTLSDKLQEIIQDQKNNWEKMIEDLEEVLQDIMKRPNENIEGLNNNQIPYFDIIKNNIFEKKEINQEQNQKLMKLTIEIYEIFSKKLKIVNFWNDEGSQDKVRLEINDLINKSGLIKNI
ncbi:type I restriction endonuclease subunit R [Candidatus Vampirococcus lugosii]|uniref:Type I restriction enzyme endonuclease subunit n=1 Tax=Candidatus Vampirococcus lugosii TaxID=2789015 RepID=A0ABS5QMU0_9BACT|nr:Type I restriction-modification system, restriction subunit R [Candidatus Vampirococcus lugosii]